MFSNFQNRHRTDFFNLEESDVNFFKLDDFYVVVNKLTNGWAILEFEEIVQLFYSEDKRDYFFFSRLYELGIVKQNDAYSSFLERELGPLCYFEINVTEDCNLACSYCCSNFNSLQKPVYMSEDIADMLSARIAEYLDRNKDLEIVVEFSGGEAFLNFSAIQSILEALYARYIKIIFVIQTNGTCISEDHVDYLARYKERLNFAISLDGISEEHNVYRTLKNGNSSFQIVEKNVKALREKGFKVQVVTVIHEKNINDIEKIAAKYYEQKISFTPLPLIPFHLEEGLSGKSREFWRKTALKIWNIDKISPERSIQNLKFYFQQPTRNFMCNRSPCGAGVNILSISPLGDIYPCYGFQGYKEFFMGNISTQNFSSLRDCKVIKDVSKRTVSSISECRECHYNIWCHGGCTTNSFTNSGDLSNKDPLFCELNRVFITKILTEYKEKFLHCDRSFT